MRQANIKDWRCFCNCPDKIDKATEKSICRHYERRMIKQGLRKYFICWPNRLAEKNRLSQMALGF